MYFCCPGKYLFSANATLLVKWCLCSELVEFPDEALHVFSDGVGVVLLQEVEPSGGDGAEVGPGGDGAVDPGSYLSSSKVSDHNSTLSFHDHMAKFD